MNPLALALALIGLITSAATRVTIAGQQVPVLWLLAAALVLTLIFAVLWLLRSLVRDGLRLSPYPGTVT